MAWVHVPPQEKRRHTVTTGQVYYGASRFKKIVAPQPPVETLRDVLAWLAFVGVCGAVAFGIVAAL